MKDNLKAIAFAAALGLVCAGLLTAANQILKPLQEANAEAERLRNVFNVLDVDYDADAPADQLVKLAEQKVRRREAGELVLYQYEHPTHGTLRAVEFSGPGLWGPVEGLLCLKGDLKTIFRISFYKHEETPGLGGEIEKPPFRRQFEGIDVSAADIAIVRSPSAPNEINAVTGATMTCDKVQAMVNRTIRKVRENRQAVLAQEVTHGQ